MQIDTEATETENIETQTIQITNPVAGERRRELTFAGLIQEGMSANLYMVWHHTYWSAMVCKMMRAEERNDQRWRELLQREGKVLELVQHPGIVRVFELNMKVPLPYLLLDYLPGATVRQVLKHKGCFSIQDALRLTMYVGSTLAHVHRQGFIHRDVKPSNVMLHAGWAKLFDFGVAWPISDELPPDKSGTPRYLAPEQCRQQILTPAVDVWALGLFLFELITGELPFPEGDYYNYNADLEVRYPQLVKPPKTFKQVNRRVPAGLQAVLDCCLALNPSERFQSVQELLIKLDPFCKTKIWPIPPDQGRPVNLASFLS